MAVPQQDLGGGGGAEEENYTYEEDSTRAQWKTRWHFVVGAIGSAVGLGNLWRFPFLVYRYGGGPFLIPYFLALVFVGIPLLILEFALGQSCGGGNVVCWGALHKRLRGLGLAAVYAGFVVVTYYNILIALSIFYGIFSFSKHLPWVATNPPADPSERAAANVAASDAFFSEKALHLAADPDLPGMIAAGNLIAAVLFTWILVGLIINNGVKSVTNVVFWTVGLPCATLIVLIISGAALPGSLDGVRGYLGTWDMSKLADASVWSSATSQIFFSIGICFGIMTTFASYNGKRMSAVKDAIIVSSFNSFYSVMAGFAVYAVLGNLALTEGSSVESVMVAGPSLAFKTFPIALAQLPMGAKQFFCILFFGTLFFLGIDSSFSLCEAAATALHDSCALRHLDQRMIATIVSVFGFMCSLLYTADIGYYLLDVVDHYTNNLLVVAIGFLYCISATWLYRLDEVEEKIGPTGKHALGIHNAAWLCAIIVGNVVGFAVDPKFFYVGPILAVVIVLVGTLSAIVVAMKKPSGSKDEERGAARPANPSSATTKERVVLVLLGPAEMLRNDLNRCILALYDANIHPWTIHIAWSIVVKYITPTVLSIVFSSTINDLAREGGYGGYSIGYQLFGAGVVFVGLLLVVIGVAVPDALDVWVDDVRESLFIITRRRTPGR